MKNKIGIVIGNIITAIGIIVVLFPLIANTASNIEINDVIKKFDIETKQNSKSEDLLYEKIQDYNIRLYNDGQDIVDAFSYEDEPVNLNDYGYEQNIIGYINIEKIKVKLPIYLGATKSNLKKGAVHLGQTSLPIGGENTNSVIAAHSGMIKNQMFSKLDKLEINDEIEIKNLWETLNYKVIDKKIIEPDDVSEVMIQDGKDLVTLVTCYPRSVNSHRLLVICERITE